MLEVGRERAASRGYAGASTDPDAPAMSWVVGDAERLPIASNSVDLYTIAFGIRNVTRVDAALGDAFRVLKPGGRFMCLEFSRVDNPLMRQAYDLVRQRQGYDERERERLVSCRSSCDVVSPSYCSFLRSVRSIPSKSEPSVIARFRTPLLLLS